MKIEDLITGFEDCTLAPDRFHHREHVQTAWHYLRTNSLLDALNKFSVNLRRFASAHGHENLYHETITWAYFFLIHERLMRDGGNQLGWDEFAATNADLFDWKNNILQKYYRDETLRSDLARRIFIFPDKL
jgi:hypothetical protein